MWRKAKMIYRYFMNRELIYQNKQYEVASWVCCFLVYLQQFFITFKFDEVIMIIREYKPSDCAIMAQLFYAYSGTFGQRFRKHPDTKPEVSGHFAG
jgi:hypothetical protein